MVRTFLVLLAAVMLSAALLALAACWFVGPPPEREPELLILPAALQPRMQGSLADLVVMAGAQPRLARLAEGDEGAITVTYPPSRCSGTYGGFPAQRMWLKPWRGSPDYPFPVTTARAVAGKDTIVSFYTDNQTWIPGRPAPTAALLIVSLRARQEPLLLTDAGMNGCFLQVHPDLMLAPDGVGLVREMSRLTLRLKPPASLVGLQVYMQALLHEPGANTSGLLLSPMVSFAVASQ